MQKRVLKEAYSRRRFFLGVLRSLDSTNDSTEEHTQVLDIPDIQLLVLTIVQRFKMYVIKHSLASKIPEICQYVDSIKGNTKDSTYFQSFSAFIRSFFTTQ